MSDEFFWNLTLPLFLTLWKRHQERQKQAYRRAGEVAAATYNVHRDRQKRPDEFDWTDVFTEFKPAPIMQTEEEMMAAMDVWAALHPKE